MNDDSGNWIFVVLTYLALLTIIFAMSSKQANMLDDIDELNATLKLVGDEYLKLDEFRECFDICDYTHDKYEWPAENFETCVLNCRYEVLQ